MNTYKVTETIIYYVEAEDPGHAMQIGSDLDKADSKKHYLEVDVLNE